jgi:eukaryotic-like serine/threonine-protein kinase
MTSSERANDIVPAPWEENEFATLASPKGADSALPASGSSPRAPEDTPFEEPGESYALPVPEEIIGEMYRVERELSRGAMGVVFLAFDERLRRTVAIKVIRSDLLRPGFVRRFMHEAQAMARVTHPHVVAIHALGEHRAAPYFVMEHIQGQTLEAWLSRNPVGLAKAADLRPGLPAAAPPQTTADLSTRLRMLGEVCSGVAAIHAAGTVHCDIKPSNILLDEALCCHVADFGLSTLSYAESTEVVGTPAYMAPELAWGVRGSAQPISPISDVYSLGCVAYELLTGSYPLRTPRASQQQLEQEFPPPSSVCPGLPRALDHVLLNALKRDPRLRTSTIADFQRNLQDAQALAPDRILIAEDDDDFRELLCEALQAKFPWAEIESVANGRAALAAIEVRPASIALLDLQMPDLDGGTLTQVLRSRPHTAAMPIIVLSGSGGAAEWKFLSSLGADRFLVKPVNLGDVVATIERVMQERSSGTHK